MLDGLKPHHFSISVPDMADAIQFWSEVFGFSLEKSFRIEALKADGAFLAGPGVKLELWALYEARSLPEDRKTPNADLLSHGTKHMAFSLPNLQSALEALQDKGVAIVAVQRDPHLPMLAEADVRRAAAETGTPAFASFIATPGGALVELLQAGAD